MRKNEFKKSIRFNNRALSPIFATLILIGIVIVFGSAAYYYANNVTTTSTNQLTQQISDSQQSLSERIGFENAIFIASDTSNNPSPPSGPTLTVYIINSGSVNNIQLSGVLIYDSNHNLINGNPYDIVPNTHSAAYSDASFVNINGGNTILPLNIGEQGLFAVKLASGTSLTPGSYSIQLITKSGSSFVYAP